MLDLKIVAERLDRPELEVMQQSLRAYLLREIGLIEAEIQRYRERYSVFEPEEQHNLIEAGAVSPHPAWEDYLEWQNGVDAVADLHELLLSDASQK